MKEKWKFFLQKYERFANSDYYILLASVVVFLGWLTGFWPVALCVLLVLCALPLYFTRSNKTWLVFFLQFTYVISHARHDLSHYWWLLFLLVPAFAGIVVHGIRNRKEFSVSSFLPKNIKGQHGALVLMIIPFALGGIARAHEKPVVVLFAFLIMLLIAVIYTYFVATNVNDEQRKELPTYVLKNLFAVGVLISVELIVFYLQKGSFSAISETIRLKTHELGWGGPNNIGAVYTLTIPATLYFCTYKNKLTPLYVVIAIIEFALLVSTGSRGSTLAVLVALPVLILYIMAVTPNKRAFGISVCLSVFAALFLVVLKADAIVPMLSDRLAMGFSSNGRFEFEYPAAIEGFCAHPVFGCGWDYLMGTKINDGYTPLWFHSSVLQVMATMGGLGLLFFGYWCFQRYRTYYLMRFDKRALFLLASTLTFGAYSLVDTGFFAPSFLITSIIMMFSVEINLPENTGMLLPYKWRVSKQQVASVESATQEEQTTQENAIPQEIASQKEEE